MEFYLDDQQIDCSDLDCSSVENLLREVQDQHCGSSQMVVSVACDGEMVNGDALGKTLAMPPSDFAKIEVSTAIRESLVLEALSQAGELLEGTRSKVDGIAGLLSEGKEQEGADALAACITVWQQVHQAIEQSLRMLELDPSSLELGGKPALDMLVGPTEVLVQIKDALLANDYVLLADVLQYEFGDACDQWVELISALAAETQRMMTP